jgi:hypothetical protein
MKNKLLWVLIAVMLFDFGVTIAGQPSGYWHDPSLADEGNPLFRVAMLKGWPFYFAAILAYVTAVAALVTWLPRRIGLTTGLAFLLVHYLAGSTWLLFHFHLGLMGPILYAVAISMALMSILYSGDLRLCFMPANGEEK